jgi:hypothetical protein
MYFPFRFINSLKFRLPLSSLQSLQQTIKLTEESFSKRLNNSSTKGIGIITGFDFLEVIDVDTKVFSTQQEKDDFWAEYYGTLKDNILDFEDKFSVYQTKSGGFHILYKSKRIKGNTKIASLKGHKEAVIESRGNGGYVFVYPDKKYSKNSYFNVDFISDKDHEILWEISKSYSWAFVIKEYNLQKWVYLHIGIKILIKQRKYP